MTPNKQPFYWNYKSPVHEFVQLLLGLCGRVVVRDGYDPITTDLHRAAEMLRTTTKGPCRIYGVDSRSSHGSSGNCGHGCVLVSIGYPSGDAQRTFEDLGTLIGSVPPHDLADHARVVAWVENAVIQLAARYVLTQGAP